MVSEELEIHLDNESNLESKSFVAFFNFSIHSIAGDENECLCNFIGESRDELNFSRIDNVVEDTFSSISSQESPD